MAKLLDCRDMELECDFICAETEEEVLTRAARHARLEQTMIDIPSEFEDRVRSVLRTIDHC
jgi:predicted small metal-binding protein